MRLAGKTAHFPDGVTRGASPSIYDPRRTGFNLTFHKKKEKKLRQFESFEYVYSQMSKGSIARVAIINNYFRSDSSEAQVHFSVAGSCDRPGKW